MGAYAAIVVLALPGALSAQSAVPIAELDTTVLRIGERAVLTLRVDYRADAGAPAIEWPAIGDSLGMRVEVVRDSGVDTIRPHGDRDPLAIRQVRSLHLTSFDTGYWAIAPFRFTIDGRAVETDALLLEVRGTEVDSAGALRDIKDIIEAPFNPLFWLREYWYWPAGGALLAALAWLVVTAVRRKPKHAPASAPEPLLPPHERVLRDLEALERERLWQQGAHKEYCSRLTGLLRWYIEERYQVPALESTTDELLAALRVGPLDTAQQNQLANVLRLADMVKFAKALPSPQENEGMMAAAARFVRDTAPPTATTGTNTEPATVHAP